MTTMQSKGRKRPNRPKHTIPLPLMEPLGKISCPRCGNDAHFVEQVEYVKVMTTYLQNSDGSFTPVEQSGNPEGATSFHCAECGLDLTPFHAHFREMTF